MKKMRIKKTTFRIGDYVMVSHVSFRSKQEGKVKWLTVPFGEIGQVVGITTRYDGEIESTDYDGQNYFRQTKQHRFWLVRFGLSNRPECVQENDMRLATQEEIHELPYSYPPREVSERDKQNLREDSKFWPRDSKGRWISGPNVYY